MANWQRKLDVKEEWRKAKAGQMTIPELAVVVADKLEALAPFGEKVLGDYGIPIDDEKEQIVEDLRGIAADSDASADDFDTVWNELYNWADTNLDKAWPRTKVCWVGIF